MEHSCKLVFWKNSLSCRAFATIGSSQRVHAEGFDFCKSISMDNKSAFFHPCHQLVYDPYYQSGLLLRSRKLWTTVPVQMGRRSSKIAMRKVLSFFHGSVSTSAAFEFKEEKQKLCYIFAF